MVVSVIFRGYRGKSYDYLTDLDLVRGDPVAVPTGDLGTGDATCADVEHVAIAQVIRTKRASPMAKAWGGSRKSTWRSFSEMRRGVILTLFHDG